jgi:hypothetical protein
MPRFSHLVNVTRLWSQIRFLPGLGALRFIRGILFLARKSAVSETIASPSPSIPNVVGRQGLMEDRGRCLWRRAKVDLRTLRGFDFACLSCIS